MIAVDQLGAQVVDGAHQGAEQLAGSALQDVAHGTHDLQHAVIGWLLISAQFSSARTLKTKISLDR